MAPWLPEVIGGKVHSITKYFAEGSPFVKQEMKGVVQAGLQVIVELYICSTGGGSIWMRHFT